MVFTAETGLMTTDESLVIDYIQQKVFKVDRLYTVAFESERSKKKSGYLKCFKFFSKNSKIRLSMGNVLFLCDYFK